MSRFAAVIAVFFAVLFFSGCSSTPVVQDLTQNQANEVVAALTSQGIEAIAKKESGGRGLYSVQIPAEQYAEAVSLLHERGLPSEPRPSMNDLLASQGIIPSSREMEALRLDYALGTQVEEELESLPNVQQARCVVRLNFLKNAQTPSVSIVVQHRQGTNPLAAETITDLVQRAIPGVNKNNISLALGDAPELSHSNGSPSEGISRENGAVHKVPLVSFLWLWRVPADEYTELALLFSGALIVVGIAAAGLGYWTCMYHRTRDTVETNLPEVFPKSLRLDRVRKDLPE